MNGFGRHILIWVGIILMIAFFYNLSQQSATSQYAQGNVVAYSDFMREARDGTITSVLIRDQKLIGEYSGTGEKFVTIIPPGENVVDRLADTAVRIKAEHSDPNKISLVGVLLSWFPMLLLIGVWIFFMRQMQGKGGSGAMGF
ncbi:MAG: ATP-dependent metallopeptidase FtsH/Yme1/Tma family protein, partial [Pseudomonadota bacterium]|nr:ATP-dependent metallopeptidase FtsH/Yme1/Tma family protein [Pseudomonadota bacterium]